MQRTNILRRRHVAAAGLVSAARGLLLLVLLLLSLFRRSWNGLFSLTLVIPVNPDSWEPQDYYLLLL